MSAISYSLVAGQNLEQVTTGTLAPNAGQIELRIDTTSSSVKDGSSTRALKRGEAQMLIRILEQYLLKDTNIPQ